MKNHKQRITLPLFTNSKLIKFGVTIRDKQKRQLDKTKPVVFKI
jgi:hypothetical protein